MFSFSNTVSNKVKVLIKLPMCLIKHHYKTYGRFEIYSFPSPFGKLVCQTEFSYRCDMSGHSTFGQIALREEEGG